MEKTVTAPGTVAFSQVSGYTQAMAPQFAYAGSGSLRVTDTAAVPEPTSVTLLGVGPSPPRVCEV
jgi:hypothetical protein